MIGVDRHETDNADELSLADRVARLPAGENGLANIAGLPPTVAAAQLMKVNLIGLRTLTEGLVGKPAADAAIVNLASLAGFGCPPPSTR